MRLILHYIFRYKAYLVLGFVGVLGFVAILMGIPTLLKYIINDALLNQNKELLYQLVGGMFACMIAGVLGELAMYYSYSKICTNVIRDIRNDIYAKTQSFSNIEFHTFSVSSLITSTTSDAYQIMIFTQSLLKNMFIIPFISLTGFVLIYQINPLIFWVVLIIVPFIMILIVFIGIKSKYYSDKQQITLDEINLSMRENLSGLRVIRSFRKEAYRSEGFDKINNAYATYSQSAFRITAFTAPGFFLIFNVLVASIFWMGANFIQEGSMDVGTLTALVEYIFHILFSFAMLGVLFIMYPRASVSAKRIQRILQTTPTIVEKEDAIDIKQDMGSVVFEDVSFSYDSKSKQSVLSNISFEAKQGEVVAFIGSTGSGKSTLVQLIPRMYDVSSGRILVDGVDVRDYTFECLRGKIGFIPQKAQLFSGTIADNLRVGKKDATKEEMQEALQLAQASSFVQQKEKGLEEMLSEGGSNLSGGQKQRLAIARAMIKQPKLFVFDDSFSALDAATDAALRHTLATKLKDTTILIVAQRIETIKHADVIVVLEEGHMVAKGTHEFLLKNSPLYYDIAASQLSKEELL